VTEELWDHLKESASEKSKLFEPASGWEEALIIARWPEADPAVKPDEQAVSEFGILMEIIRSIRNFRAEKKIPAGKKIAATVITGSKNELIERQADIIAALAHLDPNKLNIISEKPYSYQGQASIIVMGIEIYLALSDLVDAQKEKERLEAELKNAESQVARLEKLLAGDFATHAPVKLVEGEKQKLALYKETVEKIKQQLK